MVKGYITPSLCPGPLTALDAKAVALGFTLSVFHDCKRKLQVY